MQQTARRSTIPPRQENGARQKVNHTSQVLPCGISVHRTRNYTLNDRHGVGLSRNLKVVTTPTVEHILCIVLGRHATAHVCPQSFCQ